MQILACWRQHDAPLTDEHIITDTRTHTEFDLKLTFIFHHKVVKFYCV